MHERAEDIPCLIHHALAEFNETNSTHFSFHQGLAARLQCQSWPGNVRELKNVVWQIASEHESEGATIALHQLSDGLLSTLVDVSQPTARASHPVSHTASYDIDDARRWHELCQQHGGDVYAIASAVGVHRTTVLRKLKSYGLRHTHKKASRLPQAESDTSAVNCTSAALNGRHT